MVLNEHVQLRPSDVFLKTDPSDRPYSPWDDDDFEERLDEWLDASGVDPDDEEASLSAIEDFEQQWRKQFEHQWREQVVAEAASTDVVEVYESLKAAGLDRAFLTSPVPGGNVGGYLLACPSAFRDVRDDEAFELSRARRALLHTAMLCAKSAAGELEDAESDALEDEEGALLLLLRPTRIEMVDEDRLDFGKDDPQFVRYHMSLRSGESIELEGLFTSSHVATLRGSCWVVVEASGYGDGEELTTFFLDFVLAVPDTGPLRVSDIHPSLSKALCFDTVCRYLLSRLDLSEEPLPDPVAARNFITRIHSDGLPPGRMGPGHQGGRSVPFGERLLEAMGSISGQEDDCPGPNNDLVAPVAETGSAEELTAQRLVRNTGGEATREDAQGIRVVDGGTSDAEANPYGDNALGVLTAEAASEGGVGNFTVATWNTQWATPGSDRGPRISAILDAADSDVIVVTEGDRGLLAAHGYTVDAGGDWGYGAQPSRRKVIVWSRFPLTLDFIGAEGATRGRLAVATAETPAGRLRVVGVCIPWRDAHVTTGRRDAQPWSEHLDYLDRLAQILLSLDDGIPTVILGDFNQRIPRKSQPVRVADRLLEVLADWTVHTAGELPNGPHIDHIATHRGLTLESVGDWAASDHLGRLSDHAGVTCRLVSGGGATVGKAATGETATDRQAAQQESNSGTSQERGGVVNHQAQVHQPGGGALTPGVRAEIEAALRSSGDGLSHGATFQLREQGLSDAEIAAERGVSVSATRVFLRSLDLLLSGEQPTSKSAALTNSYVYRELLNHPRSDELDRYVMATLRTLKEFNPEVSFAPLKTRTRQHKAAKPKPARIIGAKCPTCSTIHVGEC